MKRQIEGLHKAGPSSAGLFPNTLFLVQIERARYRWHAQKPSRRLEMPIAAPCPILKFTHPVCAS